MMVKNSESLDKLPFESALDKTGFGLYSYLVTCVTALAIIAYGCISYSMSIIVPTSACELGTTGSQQGLLAAGPIVGSMLGAILWGYLADTRGRRQMLLMSLTGSIFFNLLASISVNWIMLLVFQFVASLSASGIYSMVMSLLSESVPMAKRNFLVLLVSCMFLMVQGILAVIAIPIIPLSFSYYLPALNIYWNSWRTLLVVYCLPSLVTTIWLYFMKESPKFVFVKGDKDRAMEILGTIHRINHLRSKEAFQVKGLLPEEKAQKPGGSSKDQILPLFKYPLLKYTIIMFLLFVFQQVSAFLVWLPTIADQFVRILETGENSDINMCGILKLDTPIDENAVPCALNEVSLLIVGGVGAFHAVFNFILSLLVNKVGRRNLVLVITTFCGVCGILVNLVPNAIGSAVFFVLFITAVVVSGLYVAIIVALFPTKLTTLSITLSMTGGAISVFASIQILNLMLTSSCEVGFYVYASLIAIPSVILASFLPDDSRLPKEDPPPTTYGGSQKNN